MGAITIRELNANVSRAVARVEAGETLDITRNGKAVAELRPKPIVRDANWHAARARLDAMMKQGFGPGKGTVSYEEKHGADPL